MKAQILRQQIEAVTVVVAHSVTLGAAKQQSGEGGVSPAAWNGHHGVLVPLPVTVQVHGPREGVAGTGVVPQRSLGYRWAIASADLQANEGTPVFIQESLGLVDLLHG
ncbi:hypothetical protein XthCFBP4691_19625 [Xanthomonas theicola]|uniref:Uncharacterized protein n=1 Tax=Xanthomonas theicola TaxID=56464 RepID=A0A2S6Z4U4_9XANT|nr:hypothetical protein XthCFBP4691_19625 [Xanthomonas theicola]